MLKTLRGLLLVALTPLLLSACASSGLQLDDFQDKPKTFALEEFFNGPVKGWGIVQGFNGGVKRTFEVAMNGSWVNNTGTLKEHFVYDDGKTQERTWTIVRHDDGTYEGFAADVVDSAHGMTEGNALEWNYQMDIQVDDDTYRLALDDWMFRMDDRVVINRSYLKKYGVTVAELTLFMQKQDK